MSDTIRPYRFIVLTPISWQGYDNSKQIIDDWKESTEIELNERVIYIQAASTIHLIFTAREMIQQLKDYWRAKE